MSTATTTPSTDTPTAPSGRYLYMPADQILDALGALRTEIAVDARLRTVETSLAALTATVAASSRPPVWPQILSALVGVGGVLVAFAALLNH